MALNNLTLVSPALPLGYIGRVCLNYFFVLFRHTCKHINKTNVPNASDSKINEYVIKRLSIYKFRFSINQSISMKLSYFSFLSGFCIRFCIKRVFTYIKTLCAVWPSL